MNRRDDERLDDILASAQAIRAVDPDLSPENRRSMDRCRRNANHLVHG